MNERDELLAQMREAALNAYSFEEHELWNEAATALAAAQEQIAAFTAWVCERWRSEVANRPLENIHRRTLDGTWRQMLRHLGADDEALLGPDHQALLDMRDAANLRAALSPGEPAPSETE